METDLITICIPCKNRTYDLKNIIPKILAVIDEKVEILVLNYGSTDDLDEYIKTVPVSYIKYMDNPFFHMAHSRNILGRQASGKYILTFCADVDFKKGFIEEIRKKLSEYDCVRISGHSYPGIIVVKKEDFIKVGGYDERFEFYGGEDKELIERLLRNGLNFGYISQEYLSIIPTSKSTKIKHYRIKSWHKMKEYKTKIWAENTVNNLMTANVGKDWGGLRHCNCNI